MTDTELKAILLNAVACEDFITAIESSIERTKEEGAELGHVRAILQFMEEHPSVDFGTPGPLVHFVERFFGKGYEEELLASISRHPTAHTAWMLNRIINGTRNDLKRVELIEFLHQAKAHPMADNETRNLIARFLERLP